MLVTVGVGVGEAKPQLVECNATGQFPSPAPNTHPQPTTTLRAVQVLNDSQHATFLHSQYTGKLGKLELMTLMIVDKYLYIH